MCLAGIDFNDNQIPFILFVFSLAFDISFWVITIMFIKGLNKTITPEEQFNEGLGKTSTGYKLGIASMILLSVQTVLNIIIALAMHDNMSGVSGEQAIGSALVALFLIAIKVFQDLVLLPAIPLSIIGIVKCSSKKEKDQDRKNRLLGKKINIVCLVIAVAELLFIWYDFYMKKIFYVFFIICVTVNAFAEKKIIPFPSESIEVSSYLVEGKTEYSKSCLTPESELPWVSASGNNGIGETITIKDCAAMDLYISIGYVSKNRPDLYEKNSRPKEVSIKFLETGKNLVFTLKDTSEPQQLKLFETEAEYFSHPKNTLILSFPSVYEGSKYKDLCVNYIGVSNLFSGLQWTVRDTDALTDPVITFGSDTADFLVESYSNDHTFEEIVFKYAHNKELNILYLYYDKVKFSGQNRLMNLEEAIEYIGTKDFINSKKHYLYDKFTSKQWSKYQKSFSVMLKERFENPMCLNINFGSNYGNLELSPILYFFDERLFSQLDFNSSIVIRSCDDYLLSYGFWSNSETFPRAHDQEHWSANYTEMEKLNRIPDSNGYYSFVAGFEKPITIKYKLSRHGKEEFDSNSKYYYHFEFVYPDGSIQNGYFKGNIFNLRPTGNVNSEFYPKDFEYK